MPKEPPQIEKFSFKDQVQAVNGIIRYGSLTLIVIMRRDIGYRYLNPFRLFGTAFAMLIVAGMGQSQTNRPGDLAAFAICMLAAGLCRKFVCWRQIGKRDQQHSYYIGDSHFQFRWLPQFISRNRRVERFFDPLFCFTIGLVIGVFSHALGLWIIVSALCLRLLEYRAWQQVVCMQLDVADSMIYAEYQSDAVERFSNPSPPTETKQGGASGISTGLDDDIHEKIKRKKTNQRPTIVTAPPATNQSGIKRQPVILGFAIAIFADLLQCPYHGTTLTAWFFIPGEWWNATVDAVTLACIIRLLGFHWIAIIAFLLELIPELASLPFWTACVVYLVWQQKKQLQSPLPPKPEPEIMHAEIIVETTPQND